MSEKVRRYKKVPVIIEALKWDGSKESRELSDFFPDAYYFTLDDDLYIETLEGDMKVSKGDYIIKGVKGEFYPCKPDIFLATYEAVND